MKQVLKSTKRKYLVGGIAAFAGIALLTTGVATWVIGANSSTQNDVTVTVDGKQNNSAYITVESVTGLKIGEKENVNKGFVQVTDANQNNMKVTLTKVKFKYGAGFKSNDKKIALQFAIEYIYDESGNPTTNSKNLVADGVSKVTRSVAKDAKLKSSDAEYTTWQYIAAPSTVLDLETLADGTGADVEHTIDSLDVNFNWGSFFNGQLPSTYYNELSLSTVDDAENVEYELAAMHTALNNSTIKLTAELVAQ